MRVDYFVAFGDCPIGAAVPSMPRVWASGTSVAQVRGRIVAALEAAGAKYRALDEHFVNGEAL
jgi:hypothetical protein